MVFLIFHKHVNLFSKISEHWRILKKVSAVWVLILFNPSNHSHTHSISRLQMSPLEKHYWVTAAWPELVTLLTPPSPHVKTQLDQQIEPDRLQDIFRFIHFSPLFSIWFADTHLIKIISITNVPSHSRQEAGQTPKVSTPLFSFN